MRVALLNITEDALNAIGEYAAICYGSSRETEANRKRALHCKDKGHLSTLRHAIATFHVAEISRVCSHQMVRSKHLDFLQRSQRYVKETTPSFTLPDSFYDIDDPCLKEDLYNHMDYAWVLYNDLIEAGVKKEDARFILPEATHTELIVTGNFQAWMDFINLRTDKAAQYEIRVVATRINNILAAEVPGLFEYMEEPTR